jgi:transposase
MDRFSRIGVDLGKGYFQLHGLPTQGGPALKRKLSRPKMRAFFAAVAPCRIGMEACGSAHYWARELAAIGHEVVLMPPAYIKPYVKRGKNDAVDAAAICEAMARPDMRFVPIKSADQQAMLMLHKTRELMVKQRTMSVNALRSHLAEFGLVVAQGVGRVDELSQWAENDPSLPQEAREAAKLLTLHIEALSRSIDAMERKIARAAAGNRTSRLLDRVPGVGPLTASAIAASVPNPGVFKSGRDFAAWLGLTPRQNSSGGKARLGGITKQGNRYIRKLLVVGATAVLRYAASKRSGPLADWIAALRTRKPERVVTVALANKLARVCWAIMTTGEFFRQETFVRT